MVSPEDSNGWTATPVELTPDAPDFETDASTRYWEEIGGGVSPPVSLPEAPNTGTTSPARKSSRSSAPKSTLMREQIADAIEAEGQAEASSPEAVAAAEIARRGTGYRAVQVRRQIAVMDAAKRRADTEKPGDISYRLAVERSMHDRAERERTALRR